MTDKFQLPKMPGDEAKDPLGDGCAMGCAGILSLVAIIVVTRLIGPIFLLFLLGCGGWYLAKKGERLILKVTADFLMAVTYGLGILCGLLIIFNFFNFFEPEWVLNLEELLVRIRLHLNKWPNFYFPIYILIMCLLAIINYYYARLEIITGYLEIQRVASRVALVLSVITTFTFFSKESLHQIKDEALDDLIWEYEIAIRDEWVEVGKNLIAENLVTPIRCFSVEEIDLFKAVFETIAENGRPYLKETSAAVASRFAENFKENVDFNVFRRDIQDEISKESNIDPIPKSVKSVKQWENLKMRVSEQERSLHFSMARTEQMIPAIRNVLVSTLGLGTSSLFDGIAGAYINSLITNYAETLFSAGIEHLRYSKKPTFDLRISSLSDNKINWKLLLPYGDRHSNLEQKRIIEDIRNEVRTQVKNEKASQERLLREKIQREIERNVRRIRGAKRGR